jgi:GH25 family lysozyme M1 (1,4-beta-N-acetylmuramidase)
LGTLRGSGKADLAAASHPSGPILGERLNTPSGPDDSLLVPPSPRAHSLGRAFPRSAVGLLLVALLVPVGVLAGPAPDARAATRRVIDGPDVASYQHPYGQRIHWGKVARDGKEFAIVKASEGTSYRNPWFAKDYRGARRAGLVRGSYHFARPAYPIVGTARAQARYYARRLGHSPKSRRTLPPALDLEVTGGLPPAALVTWAQTFLLELRRRTHRTPMIYTYPYFWDSALRDPAALARYRLWMASYDGRPSVPHSLWQYTSAARVRGIVGGVDMSRFTGDRDAWRRLANGTLRDRWAAQAPGVPQSVRASFSGGKATLRWMPGDTGSSDIRAYVVSVAGEATYQVGATTFSLRIPGLERGRTYEISVAARNAVGRGKAAVLDYRVPLRRAELTVTPPAAVVFGADGLVRARLTKASGDALAGRRLAVAQRVVGSDTWQPLPDAVTDDRGRVAVSVPSPTTGTEVSLTFADKQWRTVRQSAVVAVRSAVAATLEPELLVPGAYSVRGAVTPVPSAPTTVRRQEWSDGAWHTVQTTATLLDGGYWLSFTPPPGDHRYRIVVDEVDGRLRGYSAELALTVD